MEFGPGKLGSWEACGFLGKSLDSLNLFFLICKLKLKKKATPSSPPMCSRTATIALSPLMAFICLNLMLQRVEATVHSITKLAECFSPLHYHEPLSAYHVPSQVYTLYLIQSSQQLQYISLVSVFIYRYENLA